MTEQTTQEQIVEMDINLLRTFKDHPFKVAADYPMIQLKESIESYGILTPLLVRPLRMAVMRLFPDTGENMLPRCWD